MPVAKVRPMTDMPTLSHEEILRIELETLRARHRDLDAAVDALNREGRADPLTLKRLKKQKLAIKDRIFRIEDELNPDIIA
jgi:hypothetical protein